jgi:hypothetical protein
MRIAVGMFSAAIGSPESRSPFIPFIANWSHNETETAVQSPLIPLLLILLAAGLGMGLLYNQKADRD